MKNLIALFSMLLLIVNVSAQKPKLVVGIVIDQMCYEYLYRYQPNFSKNGFNRFLNQGVNYRNTLYNYVPTYTGPGHASIYTGTTPNNHGIIGNEWYDKNKQRTINCVADENYKSIGTVSLEGNCSPKNLKTYTITDQLKLTYPTSKVFSFSIKDRGAILPGGHLSDGSFWYDYSSGKFITSSFYTAKLPEWLEEFNSVNNASTYLKKWDLLLNETMYESADDSPYEVIISGKEKAIFPYDFPSIENNMSVFTLSPFANTLLTDASISALENENLGRTKECDFLAISYSTPDIAGHAFGPYSRELEDMYYRLDREIERLIDKLEKQVGKKNLVVFLTADHAVAPVPQMLIDKKLPGGYIYMDQLLTSLKDTLKKELGITEELILIEENQNFYLDQHKIKSGNFPLEEITKTMKKFLLEWPGIKAVYTKEELMLEQGVEDEWKIMVRKGYDYNRSGDIVFIVEPGYLPKRTDTPNAHKGTSHGSSFNYDAHVPLLWYGKNWKKKEVFTPYEITDIAPTLVHLLNLQRPGAMTGVPLEELLKK
ncbi:MAG: alkaline phosphatase family protein [Bacteroidetes bacterium]|nr:alkaline phosphatase family protein [Bacteroidota bacterium]